MLHRTLAVVALLALFLPAGAVLAADEETVDRRWLDRLPKLDRTLVDELIGKPAPEFTDSLTWRGGEALTWEDLQGKVVVVQTWSCGAGAARRAPQRIEKALGDDRGGATVLLLHTPQSADDLDRYLERVEMSDRVVVDSTGAFCDALGAYKRPVNFIIDRSGIVRYAGLKIDVTNEAVARIAAEPWDESDVPAKPSEPDQVEPVAFPTFSGGVGSAKDLRGSKAPDFHVDQWISSRPDATDKVVVLDFWATWCGPCVAAIPHMNELASTFGNDVCIIGLSSEKQNDFANGMRRIKKTPGSFNYALALDPSRQMQNQISIRGIPHCVVISSDWIVRWQGHPSGLTTDVMRQIVTANKSVTGAEGSSTDPRRRRWTAPRR